MRRTIWPETSLMLLISLCLVDLSAGAICCFQGAGGLSGENFYSKACGISADGTTVAGASNSAFGTEAFRWENGSMIGLGDLEGGGFLSRAYGISANGEVIVGTSFSDPGSSVQAFRYENGVMTGLGCLPGAPYTYSVAYGVSADGSVVVGESESGSGTEAFRWTQEEGMVGLGFLDPKSFPSTACGISADGSVIVGDSRSFAGMSQAFRWTQEEGMVGLGFLDPGQTFPFSMATAISADGSVIVGMSTAPLPTAFRWEDGVMTDLGIEGYAYGVSADGSVIVGETSFAAARSYEAFIWDQGHGVRYLRDVLADECGLDLTGWILERGTGVSADGLTIVGYGTNPGGFTEGWIAAIPEPVTFLLLGFGGLALLGIRNGRG